MKAHLELAVSEANVEAGERLCVAERVRACARCRRGQRHATAAAAALVLGAAQQRERIDRDLRL